VEWLSGTRANLKDRDYVGDPGVNWRKILKLILNKQAEGRGLDRDRWQALLNKAMNLRVAQIRVDLLTI
jgi:hypothetical protein